MTKTTPYCTPYDLKTHKPKVFGLVVCELSTNIDTNIEVAGSSQICVLDLTFANKSRHVSRNMLIWSC